MLSLKDAQGADILQTLVFRDIWKITQNMLSRHTVSHVFSTLISQYGNAINVRHQELRELRNLDFSPDGKLYEVNKTSTKHVSVEIKQNYILSSIIP